MMHPRNIYSKGRADFAELGLNYEEFRKHLIPTKCGDYTINFKDARALRELTVSLLDNDFGLKVELPLDRLIPTIPQRLNYIHWVEDLLLMITKDVKDNGIKGIDIGTGASCIYPLLAAKLNKWMFCASEVDDVSYRYACENVKRNNLEQYIHVELVHSDIILKPLLEDNEQCDFCMCNPPFFSDQSETTGNRSRSGTRPRPSSVCTGTVTETVTSGGEVEFVGRIIEDSLELKTRIKWYTTMLGKKSSVAAIVSKLKENNIHNIITTEFCQGRTMRWGVAWTFLPDVTIQAPRNKKRKSKPLEFIFSPNILNEDEALKKCQEEDDLVSRISVFIRKMFLELQVNILSEAGEKTTQAIRTKLHCGAESNTWANQRRRRREAARGKLETKDHANEAGNDVSNDASQCGNQNLKNELRKEAPGHETADQKDTSLDKANFVSGASANSSDMDNDLHSQDSLVQNTDSLETSLPVTMVKKPVSCETTCSDGNRKRTRDSVEERDEEYFLEFSVEVGVKLSEVIPGVLPNVFLRMNYISGQDRNSLYQLFQYFQNRLTR